MAEEAPPLRVWLFPIPVALILVLSFLYYCHSSGGPYARLVAMSNKSLENALIESTSDTSALSIVILGSSLTEYALVDPRGLEDSIYKVTNKKAKVLRVAMNYMDMNVAKRIDFFDYISKYPPNYLFIENFSFNLDRADTSAVISDQINVALLEIKNVIRTAMGLGPAENYYAKWYTFDVKPFPWENYYTHKFDSITFKALLQSKGSLVRKVSQNGVANTVYDDLTKRNTKVVFLDMPLCNKFPHNFLDQQSTDELNKLLKFYKTQYRVDYWKYPYMMDNSCFVDGAHLNSKGSLQYQKWFVSEIASRK
jgi:hypothetical protein